MTAPGASAIGQPAVSVVIVNWNTRELLANCLASLATAEDEGCCHVVVVDNSSSDGSADMVAREFPHATLVKNAENVGFARAVNEGFRRVRARYGLLLNSDTELTRGAIRRCVEYMDRHPDVAAVGCRLTFPDGRVQSSCFRFPSLRGVLLTSAWLSQAFPRSGLMNWDRYGQRAWQEPAFVDCVMGSFMLLRVAAVDLERLFDEGFFMYGEETDLCLRLARRGFKVVHLPEVRVAHVHGGSSKTPALRAWAYEANARGILRFLWKWRGAAVAWAANLAMLAGALPRSLGWLAADAAESVVRRRPFERRRALKARVLAFHARAVLAPSRLGTPWSGPHAPRALDR